MPIPIDLSDFDPYAPTNPTSTNLNQPTSDPSNLFEQLQLSNTQTTTQNGNHPLPLAPPIPFPIPSTSSTHSHSQSQSQSHPVRPGRTQSGLSPPRRLSSLMNETLSHSPPSPSSASFPFDPFHPFPSPSSSTSTTKKGRSRERSSISNELYWGEFQTATPDKSPTPRTTPRATPPPHPQRAATSPNPRDYHLKKKDLPPPPSSTNTFDPFNNPVKLVGLKPGTNRILSETIAEGIRPSLPPRLRISPKWTLLYSLDQHGTSLQSLFSCISTGLSRLSVGGGFVLCVKTEKGRVFGGYVSEEFRNDESGMIGKRAGGRSVVTGNRVWGGDGSSFLFTTLPLPPSDPRLSPLIKTYPPTYRNTYFQHSSLSSGIALGGGNDGKFGVWIDERLERGWTGESETYGNRPLTEMGDGVSSFGREQEVNLDGDGDGEEDRGKFEVVGLEAWAVGS